MCDSVAPHVCAYAQESRGNRVLDSVWICLELNETIRITCYLLLNPTIISRYSIAGPLALSMLLLAPLVLLNVT